MGRKLSTAESRQDIQNLLSQALILLDETGMMCAAAHVAMAMDVYDKELSRPNNRVDPARYNLATSLSVSE